MDEQLPIWATPVEDDEEPEENQLPSWASPVQVVTEPQPEPQPDPALPSWASPVVQPEAPVEETVNVLEGNVTPADLLKPDRLAVVDRTLKSWYGTDSIDGYTEQERVDQFVNSFRYLGAGNTIKTVGFLDHILSTDQQGRKDMLDGYELFDSIEGGWRDYTFSQNFDRVRDYVVGAVVDPVNIVAPLVGRAVASTGTTAASRLGLELARKEATRLAALGAGETAQIAGANIAKGIAIREISQATARRSAYKEIMGAAAFDTAVAIGTDIAYQHGLITIGAQEGQSRLQTGFAALGGIVGGGIGAGVVALRGTSRLGDINIDVETPDVARQASLKGTLSEMADSIDAIPDNKFVEMFGEKVARGKDLDALNTDFWTKLLLGDEDEAFKGLSSIMYDRGFRWIGKREEGDNFTNWLADAMNNSPDEDILRFVNSIQSKTGIKFSGVDSPTIRQLSDKMSTTLSESGQVLNRMSQVSKMLRFKDAKDITLDDAAKYLFGDVVGSSLLYKKGDEIYHPKFGKGTVTSLGDEKVTANFAKGGSKSVRPDSLSAPPNKLIEATGKVGEFVDWAQGSYIRLLVTHPGTSALNIMGWSTKSVAQSASDLLRGTVLYGSTGTYKALRGKGGEAMQDWGKLAGVYKANLNKVSNLLDPNTTIRAFDSLIDRDPQAFKELVGVLPGGVVRPSGKVLGRADLEQPVYQQIGDKGIEGLQYLGMVKAQDVFTKSQEMMYNLDLNLIELTGKSYRQILSDPNAAAMVASKEFRAAQSKAIGQTLDNIFSKSYARHDNQAIRRVAGFIEDFRSIPVVGATIPFGRFFNNVVGTLSEYSGANIPLKALGVAAKNQSWGETIAKPTIGWVSAVSIMDKEIELLERGISWDESVDERTGQRFSERYDAPAIGVKALARWLAYKNTTGEVPEAFLKDAGDAVLGQLTRQLSQTGDAFLETVMSVLSGEYDNAALSLQESIAGIGGTLGSGVTRFAEPVNAIIALGSSPQEYMAIDVRTGNPGFAKAFRYIDQIIGGAGMGEVLEAKSPTADYVGRVPSRMAGQRPTAPTNAINRAFAMVGRPQWDAGVRASDPIARNIVIGEFQPLANSLVQSRLLNNPVFMDGDIELKEQMLSDVLASAREITHSTMMNSVNPDNPRLSVLFKLTQSNSVPNLEAYLQELGFEVESIHELTTTELETLKFFVDNDKDLKLEDAYRRLRSQ